MNFWKARKLSILRLLEGKNRLILQFILNECVSKIVFSHSGVLCYASSLTYCRASIETKHWLALRHHKWLGICIQCCWSFCLGHWLSALLLSLFWNILNPSLVSLGLTDGSTPLKADRVVDRGGLSLLVIEEFRPTLEVNITPGPPVFSLIIL